MAGKLCTGTARNNALNFRESKAYAEGLEHRAKGTAAAYPITDNPYDGDGSDTETAWDEGWGVAHAAAPGAITASDAPCVAVPSSNISS